MASAVKLKYYDSSQYYNGEYHGDPVREFYAGAVLYDDNETLAENAQRAYLTGNAGCNNIVSYTQVEPPVATTPQTWKQEYCKTLTFGSAYARFCEELRYLQFQDMTGTYSRVLAVNGGWSSGGVGQYVHVYTDGGTSYGYHYESGSTYPLFTIDPTIMSQYQNPYGGYSYIKLLVSNNGGRYVVRSIIHGIVGYNSPSPALPDARLIRREIYTFDLRSYNVEVEVEDIPDPPEPEDEMKIKTPNLKEMFNRQYLCKRNAMEALATYVSNFGMDGELNVKIGSVLGISFTDWLDCVVDIQIFPLDLERHVAGYTSSGTDTTSVRFMATELNVSNANIDFSQSPVYPVTNRDCLFDATAWIPITRRFNDYRDYPPFTSTKLYIPFIGIVDIDYTMQYGKYMKIKYAVDISCGGCRAFVCIADSGSATDDGYVIAQFDGAMGVHCPVNKFEWGQYFNSIAQGFGNVIGSSVNAGMSLAGTSAGNMATKQAYSNQLAKANKMGKDTSDITEGNMSMYDMNSVLTPFEMGRELNVIESRGPVVSCSGSASGCLNEYCDWDCYMIFWYIDTQETSYLEDLQGYPSNASDLLKNFTGYLKCSDVRLVCERATENEKTKLVQLLTSGIYI